MDLSMKWLADYVDCDMPIKDFVSALTLSGSKVECFEQEGKDISNVVVGKVVSMERHPDSDHMFITQVDVGEDEPVQIVTGAQNVHEGDFVPVAKHKSSVLHEGKQVKITKGKLRGVASNGIIRHAMEEMCARKGVKFYRPSPILCTDNAAMIGAAAYYDFMAGKRSGLDLNAVPNLKLGE